MGKGSNALFGPKLNANYSKRGPCRQGHLSRAKFHLEHQPRCPLIAPNLRLLSIELDSQQIAPRCVAGDGNCTSSYETATKATSSAKLADATKVTATAIPFFCAGPSDGTAQTEGSSGRVWRGTLEPDCWPSTIPNRPPGLIETDAAVADRSCANNTSSVTPL